MATQSHSEIVSDPVGHISISGVHGRSELDERMRHFAPHPRGLADAPALARENLKPLLIGAAIGAAVLFLLRRR
jgi:hypothetical protein